MKHETKKKKKLAGSRVYKLDFMLQKLETSLDSIGYSRFQKLTTSLDMVGYGSTAQAHP